MTWVQNRHLERAFYLGSIVLLLVGGFWPIFGAVPGLGVRVVSVIAAASILAAIVLPRGRTHAFVLLWAALGISLATGTIGIFSVGFVYLLSAVLIVLAIITTPNETGLESRASWRLVAAFFVGYFFSFTIAFLL